MKPACHAPRTTNGSRAPLQFPTRSALLGPPEHKRSRANAQRRTAGSRRAAVDYPGRRRSLRTSQTGDLAQTLAVGVDVL